MIFAFVFLLSVVATMADDPSPCCYPDQFKADVYVVGMLMYTTYVDYTKNKAFEQWNYRFGNDFVLLDLKKMKRYRKTTSGNCKVSDMQSKGIYLQCVPGNAVDDGANPDGPGESFSFQNGGFDVKRTVIKKQDYCLPFKSKRSLGGRSLNMEFRDVEVNKVQEDIFNQDLSGCSS